MVDERKTAFITGGASGIGRALTEHLASKGWRVFIADRSVEAARAIVYELNTKASGTVAHYAETDVSSWDSQVSAFQQAVKVFNNHIHFVAPIAGIGERKWIPFPDESNAMDEGQFAKPDLTVLDVDLNGPLYTIALAVQQFRRQEARDGKWKGKIGVVASVCGLYCVPSVPVYTAAKHGVVGFVRSYGSLLPHEHITLNAICPNIIKTGISTSAFYEKAAKNELLAPMSSLMEAYDDIIEGEGSGSIYECAPNGGFTKRAGLDCIDEKTQKSMELVEERARPLHHQCAN